MKKRKARYGLREFRVRFEKGYDGFIVAECLDIPGCMSQGRTLSEARRNIRQAIQECLEVMLQETLGNCPHPRFRKHASLKEEAFSLWPLKIVAS
jgi:predicted RNase H-like HicB family nuclease